MQVLRLKGADMNGEIDPRLFGEQVARGHIREARPSEPTQQAEPGADEREAALHDLAFLRGLQAGWSFGAMDDRTGYDACIASRAGCVRALKEARAAQSGQRAGIDVVEIMRICRLFLDGKEGDYDAKACFTAIFKIAAAPTQQPSTDQS